MEDSKLILDVIVAILLAATIGYAIMLNRRLSELRKNRDDLARLVNAFNDATQRAEAGIPKLRRAAEEAGSTLQERVEKAQSLRDDLAFMIERADAMANRLEGTVRQAREVKIPVPNSGPAPSTAPNPSHSSPSHSSSSHAGQGAGMAGGTGSMSGRRAAPPPPAGPSFGMADDDSFDDERSEAERELLRALQSVR